MTKTDAINTEDHLSIGDLEQWLWDAACEIRGPGSRSSNKDYALDPVPLHEGIEAVVEVYRTWESREKLSRVVTLAEVREADYNLSPSLFVDVNDRVQHRPLFAILTDLRQASTDREHADVELSRILSALGLVGEEA